MADTSSRYQAVLFDMDGVLCDSEPFIREAGVRMFAQTYGTVVTPEAFLPFTGMGEDRFLSGVAEQHGITLDLPRDKHKVYSCYLEAIRGRLRPLAGAAAFLASCRERRCRLAVATSADRVKLEGNLREIGIPSSRFDAVVTGSDVERKKPDPQVFLLAAERVGAEPSRCLVVEDAPEGVIAACRAGARCLGLTTSFSAERLREAGAHWIAPDLAHVPDEVWNNGENP